MIDKFYRHSERLLIVLSSLCLGTLFFILLWQILSRYLFDSPSTFTEELSRLLLIAMASFGTTLCFMKRKHLALDLLLQMSTPARKKILEEIIAVAITLLGFILTVGGIYLIKEKWSLGQTSAVIGFKLVYFYFLIPFCGVLIMLSPYKSEEI